jgi:hypothetical protein
MALRLVARQMLQFAKPDDQSLAKVRNALKRAENIRRAISTPNGPQKDVVELPAADAPASGYIPDRPQEVPTINGPQKSVKGPQKSRLTRPYSLASHKLQGG